MTRRQQQQAAAQAPSWMVAEELDKVRQMKADGRTTIYAGNGSAPIDTVIDNLEQMLECRRLDEAVADQRAAENLRRFEPPRPDAASRDAAAAGSQQALF